MHAHAHFLLNDSGGMRNVFEARKGRGFAALNQRNAPLQSLSEFRAAARSWHAAWISVQRLHDGSQGLEQKSGAEVTPGHRLQPHEMV